MEDVKVREMQIFDYKKKIAEAETKLKQQQVRFNLCYLYCHGNLSRRRKEPRTEKDEHFVC